ncbi:MAG: L-threonylcarbamoyladenylate synthase, partial [Thermoplasmata archaeon]|nr:L-threonylcarbamoyladenylate synthase [Thermoplasmata archaeon]
MRPDVEAAVEALRGGGLVVYPTDTLFGLGAMATDGAAVERLLSAKGRPSGMPISVAVSSLSELEALADLPPRSAAILRQSLPGPFTFVVRASREGRRLARPILSPSGNLGVRVPDHPVARELARRVG